MASSIASRPRPAEQAQRGTSDGASDWVRGLARIFRRVALMEIRGTEAHVTGLHGISLGMVGRSFSLLEQGPLRWAVEAASPIVGAGRAPGGDQIPRALGIAPGRAYAIIPLMLGERLVALAYGDNESDALPIGQVGELFEYCKQLLSDTPRPPPAPPPKAAFRSTSRRPRSRSLRRPGLTDLRRPAAEQLPPPLPSPPPEAPARSVPPPPPADAFPSPEKSREDASDAPCAAPVSAALAAVEAIAMQVAAEQLPPDELERALFDDLTELPSEAPPVESGASEIAFTQAPPVPLPSAAEIEVELEADKQQTVQPVVRLTRSARPARVSVPPDASVGPLPSYEAEPFFESRQSAAEMVVTPQGLLPAHEVDVPSQRSPRRWLMMTAVLVAVVLAGVTAATMAPPRWGEDPVRIEVHPAASFADVLTVLEENQIIRSPLVFRLLARISGADRNLRPGEYEIEGSAWPWQVLSALRQGHVDMVTTTIPEGLTLRQLGHLLEERGITSSSRFVLAARDRRLLDRYGIQAESAEGFLFPETYTFARDLSAEQIVSVMLDHFFEQLSRLSNRTLPPGELQRRVTLASIIEREAGHPDERGRIAGVFLNRIDRGMRLESCATVQYILDKPKEHLRIADLRIQSPYNTYLNEGLPPGPIANPGLASLTAAIEPEQHDFLFFVAREDGSQKHVFTRSFGAHQAAQKRIRLRKRRASSSR